MPTFKDWVAGRTVEAGGDIVDADEFYLRDDSGDVSKRVTYSGLKTALASQYVTLELADRVDGETAIWDADEDEWVSGAVASPTPADTLTNRPAAAAGNAGEEFFVTDLDGGTLFRSNGSSWVQTAAAVNSPRFGGLYLPGTAEVNATTPDHADFDVTDLDVRALVSVADLDGGVQSIVAKWNSTGAQRSFDCRIAANSRIGLSWSPDGSSDALLNAVTGSDLSGVTTDGTLIWVRWTLDVDNGAGGYQFRGYWSPADDGTNWTELTTPAAGGATTSIFNSTSIVEVGSRQSGAQQLFEGVVREVDMRAAIAGSTIFNPLFEHPVTPWTLPGLTAPDSTGKVVTLNGQYEWREA